MKSILFLGAVVFAGLVLFGCTANNVNPTPLPTAAGTVGATPAPSAVQGASQKVVIFELAFNPAELTVKKGSTVEWTNKDSMPHTIASDSGAFESSQLTRDQSWSFTFSTSGEFPYHCSVHPQMKAKIIVTE